MRSSMMFGYVLVALTFISSVTMARNDRGTEGGNGGDAIICGSKVILFDHYEGKTKYKFSFDMGAPTLSVEQKMEIILARLQKINPNRAFLYRTWYKNFYADTDFLSGTKLVDVPDTGAAGYPVGCTLEQAAVQAEPLLPGHKRYAISKDLWDQMDNDTKAGLILHELILREMIQLGHENSVTARYFNAWLSSTEFEKETLQSYLEKLNTIKIILADTQYGFPIFLNTRLDDREYTNTLKVDFYDVNTVKRAHVANESAVIEGMRYSTLPKLSWNGFRGFWIADAVSFREGDEVRFCGAGQTLCLFNPSGSAQYKSAKLYVDRDLKWERDGVAFEFKAPCSSEDTSSTCMAKVGFDGEEQIREVDMRDNKKITFKIVTPKTSLYAEWYGDTGGEITVALLSSDENCGVIVNQKVCALDGQLRLEEKSGLIRAIWGATGFSMKLNGSTAILKGLVIYQGAIERAELAQNWNTKVGGAKITLKGDQYIHLYPKGSVKSGFLAEKAYLQRVSKKYIWVEAGQEVDFTEAGYLERP